MKSSDEALAAYRRHQDAEGATMDHEITIGRAQGEAWRAYLAACRDEGISPKFSAPPSLLPRQDSAADEATWRVDAG